MERPSQKQIDDWIAGNLPVETEAAVEAFFVENPDELPAIESDSGLLQEAATVGPEDPSITALIDTLKSRPISQLSDLPGGGWLDILTPTDQPGVLGTLAQYEVVEVLATTGMGIVLKAYDPELKRLVALKALSPALATNSTARRRFLREAKAMAKLEHHNIVPIYGIHNDAVPWFAMRYIEGGSLQEALEKNPSQLQTPEFLESLASQMGAALEAAHGAGMIHRDIKPANILLDSESERMWLTDFGIARTGEDPGLTYGDSVPGTPRYMSPEQAAGRQVDSRTDLFSLGSVMYHVATGKPPFEGSNSTAILHKVSEERPRRVTRLNPDLPAWLAELIDGLLSKEPAERPAILPALQEQKAVARGGASKWLILLVLGLAAVSGLVWYVNRDEPIKEEVAAEINMILIEETGESFTDLALALRKVPEDGTLILKGEFMLKRPFIDDSGKRVRLKAGEGTRPRVVIDHMEWWGIQLQGSLSVTGIDFERRNGPRACNIFGISGGKQVEVQDCHFYSPIDTPGSFIFGIEVLSTEFLKVSNSSFHGPRFYSVHLKKSKKHPWPTEVSVELEKSYLEGSTGFFVEVSEEPPLFKFVVKESVMNGKRFLRFGSRNMLSEVEITITDSLLDCGNELLLVEAGKIPELGEGLKWTGLRNYYGNRGYLFRLVDPGLSLNDLTGIQQKFPNYREAESVRRDLIDASGTLPPTLKGPAVQVFQRLR